MNDHPVSPGRAEQRAELRARRRAVGPEERGRAEASLGRLLEDLPELNAADTLATYLPTDGELDPNRAVERRRQHGVRTLLPVVGEKTTMRFATWTTDSAMALNRFEILEPVVDGAALLDASAASVVLVPCVATDRRGHRLGFGAGYYDRALAANQGRGEHTPTLIGICWDHAVLDRVAAESWDVAVDVIVTERRVIRPPSRAPGAR